MNLLMTGRGVSGSWQIRGVQLGHAIGATVMPKAKDVGPYDLAVIVKRPLPELVDRLHRAEVPIVWDVVDAWTQPVGNTWSRGRCLSWMADTVMQVIRPGGIVAATQAMADDCQRFGLPVLALPHHARPGIRRNPIREKVKVVAYEGGDQYIARWRPVIEAQCKARGWTFVVNPAELAEVDIMLALRDQGAYAPREWKSNVKLANPQGSGTPVVCCREAGYQETASGAERWADTPAELAAAFDSLESHAERLQVSDQLFAATPTLEAMAARYSTWLRSNFCGR